MDERKPRGLYPEAFACFEVSMLVMEGIRKAAAALQHTVLQTAPLCVMGEPQLFLTHSERNL